MGAGENFTDIGVVVWVAVLHAVVSLLFRRHERGEAAPLRAHPEVEAIRIVVL